MARGSMRYGAIGLSLFAVAAFGGCRSPYGRCYRPCQPCPYPAVAWPAPAPAQPHPPVSTAGIPAPDAAARKGDRIVGLGGTRFVQFKVVNNSSKWKVLKNATKYTIDAIDNNVPVPVPPPTPITETPVATSDVAPGVTEMFKWCAHLGKSEGSTECNHMELAIHEVEVAVENIENGARATLPTDGCSINNVRELRVTLSDKADPMEPPDVVTECVR